MPQLSMEVAHSLGRDEALRRLQNKFDQVRRQYGDSVGELTESWRDDRFEFGFRAMGMQINGQVEVGDTAVRMNCELPWAAAMLKGMIESRIRLELGDLLDDPAAR